MFASGRLLHLMQLSKIQDFEVEYVSGNSKQLLILSNNNYNAMFLCFNMTQLKLIWMLIFQNKIGCKFENAINHYWQLVFHFMKHFLY